MNGFIVVTLVKSLVNCVNTNDLLISLYLHWKIDFSCGKDDDKTVHIVLVPLYDVIQFGVGNVRLIEELTLIEFDVVKLSLHDDL